MDGHNDVHQYNGRLCMDSMVRGRPCINDFIERLKCSLLNHSKARGTEETSDPEAGAG